MTFSQLKLYLSIGGIVFCFIFLVGLNSEVSLGASVYRGASAALIFCVVTFAISNIVKLLAFNQSDNTAAEPAPKFDFKIDDAGVFTNREATGSASPEPTPVVAPSTEQAPNSNQSFEPFQAKQIDPQVSRIINNDPERMAELVRKMGLDD